MLVEEKSQKKNKITISIVQKYFLWAFVFLLPLSILPFPWDWTERSMGFVVLAFSSVIIFLEIIKLLWEGKTTVLKSRLDIGIFLLLLSSLLSTIFSQDINSSIWGIDSRLGGGLLLFISILLLAFSIRTFIKTEEDIHNTIFYFLFGLFINNLLSIFSFMGINVWRLVPVMGDLYKEGLPLLGSAKIHVLVNVVSSILCLGTIVEYFIKKDDERRLILAILFGLVSVFNLWIYSLSQGILLVLVGSILFVLISFFGLKKLSLEKNPKKETFLALILGAVLLILPIILLQIPSVREGIISGKISVVSQVFLGTEISWIIASSVLVSSFVRGLFGMGVDTYTLSYYAHKPLNINLVKFNTGTFYSANSEVLTQLANGGILWLVIWIFVGFLILKSFYVDYGNRSKIKDKSLAWKLILLDLILLFIFISSFFSPYTILVLAIFFVLISLRSVIKNVIANDTGDKFVLKFWAVDLSAKSSTGKSYSSINTFLTILLATLLVWILSVIGVRLYASLYALRAESYLLEQNQLYENKEPTLLEREEFVNQMIHYYSSAVKYDKNNPLYNRKLGLMYLESLGISAEKYSLYKEEEAGVEILRDVSALKNFAIDATRKSVDLTGSVYANWEARSRVYTGLVSIGFYDYADDALAVLSRAIELNPLNHELHYSKAQIYIVKSEKDNAMASLTDVLRINPQHIPSIILAADLNKERGNLDIYESYLRAAKKVLEIEGSTNLDIYQEISNELNNLNTKDTEVEEGEQVDETIDTESQDDAPEVISEEE